jgi:cutinase
MDSTPRPLRHGKRAVAATSIASVALIGGATAIAPHLAAHGTERITQAAAVTGAAPNGTVENNGSGARMYDYSDGAPLDTSRLAPIGSNLDDGTPVHIQCYRIGARVTGQDATGPGQTDYYWDQIDPPDAITSQQFPGHTVVVPDAYIQTSQAVDQLVPACGSSSGGASETSGSPGGQGPGTGTAAGPPAGAGDPGNGCPAIDVVFARGTTEPQDGQDQDQDQGLGSVGYPFVNDLQNELAGKTVKFYAVQYGASDTQLTAIDGANDMENHVTTMAAQCPGTKFVIAGYSQGASVVDLALGLGPTLAQAYTAASILPETTLAILDVALGLGGLAAGGGAAATLALAGPAAIQQGLPGSLAGQIAAVVTFGNPIRWSGESPQAASPVYGSKWKDFCNNLDLVCANGFDNPPLAAHGQYASNGDAQQGADFAAYLANLYLTTTPG